MLFWSGARPSIPQALAGAIEEREVHLWQLRDPEAQDEETGQEAGQFDQENALQEWVFLPPLLQGFVDKHFAAYQLQVHDAKALLEKGQIKEPKYNKIIRDSIKPLLVMHGTGQPATSKYMKEHLAQDKDTKQLFLKASWHKDALQFSFQFLAKLSPSKIFVPGRANALPISLSKQSHIYINI